MNYLKGLAFIFAIIFLFVSCQKKSEINEVATIKKTNNVPPKGFFIENRSVPGITDSNLKVSNSNVRTTSLITDPNNGDDSVILGAKLANPYSLQNMQQAINILYGGSYPIAANHFYVRFKPSNSIQLSILENDLDLELQDYPMDYEVIQEGDYYQDPTLYTEDLPWLYTVVPANYNFPSGIQKEIIDPLYLTDNPLLEDMAESMAAGAQYQSEKDVSLNKITIERLDQEVENFEFEPCCQDPTLICNYDPVLCDDPGGSGGGSSLDPNIPRGTIQVEDIRTCNYTSTPIRNVPLRQARVVCKRWFKIERTYTDDQGLFVSSKKFKNKVKIIVKTKNDFATIRKIRGIRLWQILFPVKKQLGVFDQGDMAYANFLFRKPNPTDGHDKNLPYWVAATTHNSVIEYRQYATEFGVTLPPTHLKILITNWGFMGAAGAAPMFNKCPGSMAPNFATFFIAQPNLIAAVNGLSQLVQLLSTQVDLVIGYQALNDDYNCRLTSATLKDLTYHELGHASHYAQAGCDFWIAYRQAIVNELTKIDQSEFWPYGTGNDSQNAPIIATGEMWGNHCQYVFTDRHYGNAGSFGLFGFGFTARMQGTDWPNIRLGLNCYLNAVENHNPNLAVAVHRWIPEGLCYDLNDNRNDATFAGGIVIDNVTGYTTQQCFNALQSDVRSIQAFRDRLLLQNGFAQQAQVIQLIGQYGYN